MYSKENDVPIFIGVTMGLCLVFLFALVRMAG